MSDASEDIRKAKRGRPRADTSPVLVRIDRQTIETIDNWAAAHQFGPLSRPEAIRQLISIGLGVPDSDY